MSIPSTTIAEHQAYLRGKDVGRSEREQEIIKLWGQEMKCECEDAMGHLIALIKGENK